MDFSEIGVKSRKTGITAKQNVRRDEHDMEDVDDFFRDDQTTLLNANNDSNNNNNNSHHQPPPNGRIIFPPSDIPHSPGARKRLRDSPLRSPLQTRLDRPRAPDQIGSNTEIPTNDDLFTDARELPPPEDDNDANDSGENMEIDDESKGTIKLINNEGFDENNNHNYDNDDYDYDMGIEEDSDKVPIPLSNSTPSHSTKNGQKLFVSSDDEDIPQAQRPISREERHQQLERNISVRSPSKRKTYNKAVSDGESPPTYQTSPLASTRLHSPLQPRIPSSKSIASLSRNLALNKSSNKRRFDNEPNSLLNEEENERHRPQPKARPKQSLSVSQSKKSQPKPQSKAQSKSNLISQQGRERRRARIFSDHESSDYEAPSQDEDEITKDISSPLRNESIPPETDEESFAFNEDSSDLDLPTQSRSKIKQGNTYSSDLDEEDSIADPRRGRSLHRGIRLRQGSPSSREHVIDVKELAAKQSRSSSTYPEQPTRRSSRVRVPPLAFWRNERAVFEKKKGDEFATLQKIITVDEIVEPMKTKAPSRLASRANSRVRSSKTPIKPLSRKRSARAPNVEVVEENDEEDEEEKDDFTRDVENGRVRGSEWLKRGLLKIDAFEGHGSDEKSRRLIAWAPGTEDYSTQIDSDTDNFKLAILFDKNREFIATGMMSIPPGGSKSLKSTDTTYFVFHCIAGIVEVTLSGSVFFIKKGCSLEVPMGNFYQFVNKGKTDASLFFVQTRGHDVDEWDD